MTAAGKGNGVSDKPKLCTTCAGSTLVWEQDQGCWVLTKCKDCDSGLMNKTNEKPYRGLAEKLLRDLDLRSGYDTGNVDPDIREEWLNEWADLIENFMIGIDID
jgi:hypothetical protein